MSHHRESHRKREDYKVGKNQAPEAAPELEKIKDQQENLMRRLQELKAASTEAWADVKTGVENAFEELRDTVGKAVSRFEQHHPKPAEKSERQVKSA